MRPMTWKVDELTSDGIAYDEILLVPPHQDQAVDRAMQGGLYGGVSGPEGEVGDFCGENIASGAVVACFQDLAGRVRRDDEVREMRGRGGEMEEDEEPALDQVAPRPGHRLELDDAS